MATSRAGRAPARSAAPLAAFVLHSYDWSETSLIVELFTRAQGRVVAAAKGAKRPTSNFRAVLLPFQPISVSLGKAPADEQAEVFNLRSAEWAGGAPLLAPGALMPGFYANELILKLLARQDPHPALFDAYADTLVALAGSADGGDAAALRAFELLLLRETGVLPDLSIETQTTRALQAEAAYTLDAETGLARRPEGITGSRWLAIEAALAKGQPPAVRAACAPVVGALRVPLRGVLHYHLGASKLRTRQVWLDMQRLAGSPTR
jgi:DNA repair protein RecO (recombination protein O)